MENIDTSENFFKQLAHSGAVDFVDRALAPIFKGHVYIEQLLDKGCSNLLFRSGPSEFFLSFNDKDYMFRKVPLFTDNIYRLIKHEDNGAYIIVNYKEDKFYIGSSSCVIKRIHKHRYTLVSGVHKNKALQAIYNESDKKDFHVIFIPTESMEAALNLEQELLDFFKNDIRKINLSNNARWSGDYIKSDEEKKEYSAKRSEIMVQLHKDPVFKEKLASGLREYWSNPDNRKKHSEYMNELYKDPDVKAQAAKRIMNNIHNNEEVAKRRRDNQRTFINDPVRYGAMRAKINEALATPETRAKMSESAKKRLEDPAARLAHSERIKALMSNQENRDKLRVALKDKCKPVIIEGVRFDSAHLAAKHFNISRPGLKHRLLTDNPKFKDWNYCEDFTGG